MTLNAAGIALVKEFEGWRSRAYRCPSGALTIGYGHTSRAGPPTVLPGMTIDRAEGETILKHDLDAAGREVRRLVKVGLNDNQHAALVSFCFNVGPGNLARSSVLKAVNEGRFEDVPARLQLWNRAGGRVLKGLVRRRAAEARLFMTPATADGARREADEAAGATVDPPCGKPMTRSTTSWAAILAAVSAALAPAVTTVKDLGAALGAPYGPMIAAAVFVALAAAWIIRERRAKAGEHGI